MSLKGGSSLGNSSIVCHKCHHKGHIASRCPQRALALDVEQSILENEEDQIIDPLDYSGDEDDLHESCDEDACVSVVRSRIRIIKHNSNKNHNEIGSPSPIMTFITINYLFNFIFGFIRWYFGFIY